jgi:hypothetical protein
VDEGGGAPDAPVLARVEPVRRTSLRLEVGGAALVVEAGFDAELFAAGRCRPGRQRVISQGLPIYVALEPVDMRLGYGRLGGLVARADAG